MLPHFRQCGTPLRWGGTSPRSRNGKPVRLGLYYLAKCGWSWSVKRGTFITYVTVLGVGNYSVFYDELHVAVAFDKQQCFDMFHRTRTGGMEHAEFLGQLARPGVFRNLEPRCRRFLLRSKYLYEPCHIMSFCLLYFYSHMNSTRIYFNFYTSVPIVVVIGAVDE